jgi:tubulin polyglutamylase TTLL2
LHVHYGNTAVCKPASAAQGNGIKLIRSLAELSYDRSTVVQRYIDNPHLIGGYKYDLRIYVLVKSFRPLQVHLYRRGLARFACHKYDSASLGDLTAHLTNSSIAKHTADYQVGSRSLLTITSLTYLPLPPNTHSFPFLSSFLRSSPYY